MDARGLVLAEPVVSEEQVPPFANTAVDGYAVRASDVAQVPVDLRVIDEVAAGAVAQLPVSEGTAIRIMTGAPIPDGCDAIVMVEDTERLGDDGVRILKSVAVTSGIRDAGSDVEAGAVVFQPGVTGQLKRAWAWPIKTVISILDLTGDKTFKISDDGAAMITVNSGLATYSYILPAQSK
jgi:molybdopterin biosynthesis enzyme